MKYSGGSFILVSAPGQTAIVIGRMPFLTQSSIFINLASCFWTVGDTGRSERTLRNLKVPFVVVSGRLVVKILGLANGRWLPVHPGEDCLVSSVLSDVMKKMSQSVQVR